MEKRGIGNTKEANVKKDRYIMKKWALRETEVLKVSLVNYSIGKEGNMMTRGLQRPAMTELQEHPGWVQKSI